MSGFSVSGGDVRVIATLEEIGRVGAQLRIFADRARSAAAAYDPLLDPDPVTVARLYYAADEADTLAVRCGIAADQYYDLEVGNTAMLARLSEHAAENLEIVRSELPATPWLSGLGIVNSVALTLGLAASAAIWSNHPLQTEAVRAAAGFAPGIFGTTTPQSMLQKLQRNLSFLGIRSETGSFVVPGAVVATTPAHTLAEHAARLSHAYRNPASGINVEQYQTSSGRQFVVYVPGTQSAGLGKLIPAAPGKQSNPFDLRSNLNAMAGAGLAASERAVQQSLSSLGAGSKPGDRVLFVAHSQGALISANIASEKQPYKVSGLISFAGPISHLDLRGVPTLALEHVDDPVPALSGPRNPLTLDLLTVRAESGQVGLVAAHTITGYAELARAVDASSQPAVQNMLDRLALPEQAHGTAQSFLLRRSNDGVICSPPI